MKLSKNFDLQEFASHDGAPFPDDVLQNLQELAANLQVLRDYLGCSIHINSGYRSVAHNKAIGGEPNSQHLLGKAADISCQKYTPKQVEAAILLLIGNGRMKQGGLGLYPCEFVSWKSAYDAGNLYGTNQDNTTFQFDGIDQFPVPPSR